ncbi:hypothetical protein OH77DRAFT_1438117 [Trametes cingulata]|nr:hypothetical protein OH77DRAFT_1438117 [Trametes cingulata]
MRYLAAHSYGSTACDEDDRRTFPYEVKSRPIDRGSGGGDGAVGHNQTYEPGSRRTLGRVRGNGSDRSASFAHPSLCLHIPPSPIYLPTTQPAGVRTMSSYSHFAASDAPLYPLSSTLRWSTAPNVPVPSTQSTSPTRPLARRARGTENAPPSRPSRSDDLEESEEEKVIFDMGIEDPDEEEQRELFDSIRGFSDPPSSEDDRVDGVEAQQVRKSGIIFQKRDVAWNSHRDAVDGSDADEWEGSSDVCESELGETASGEGSVVEASDHTASEGSDDEVSTDTETSSDDEDGTASNDTGEDHEYATYSTSGGSDEEGDIRASASTGGASRVALNNAHSRIAARSSDVPSGVVRVQSKPPSGRPRIALHIRIPTVAHSATTLSSQRENARAKGTPRGKRTREDEDPDDTYTPHPKRGRTTPISPEQTSPKRRTTQGKHTEGKAMKVHTPAPSNSRDRRVAAELLLACLLTEPREVACGHPGCSAVLTAEDPKAARAHHKAHYAQELKGKAATVKCTWDGCEQMVKTDPCSFQRHFNKVHLKLEYKCPGDCKRPNGEQRTFKRSDEIKRHAKQSPCEGRAWPSALLPLYSSTNATPSQAKSSTVKFRMTFFIATLRSICTSRRVHAHIHRLSRCPLYHMQSVFRLSFAQNLAAATYPLTRSSLARSGMEKSPPSTSRAPPRDEPDEKDRVVYDMDLEDLEKSSERCSMTSLGSKTSSMQTRSHTSVFDSAGDCERPESDSEESQGSNEHISAEVASGRAHNAPESEEVATDEELGTPRAAKANSGGENHSEHKSSPGKVVSAHWANFLRVVLRQKSRTAAVIGRIDAPLRF